MINPRYLTKSRFKLALSCPTKLYYTKKEEYEDTSETDSFLKGLAQGGFQVEELARMYFPDGIAILGEDWNYDQHAARTAELLKQENVTIFEAAFLHDGLFIRTDILEKKGNNIRLIEVKAKSMDSTSHDSFIKSKGKLGWSEYLYDVAFQQYVIQQCHPEWNIKPYLNLVDKSKRTTVDGLNSHFKIVPNSELRTSVEVTPGLTRDDLGASILAIIEVNEEVQLIFNENPQDPERSFSETVEYFKTNYQHDLKIETPIGPHCYGCEFKLDDPPTGKLSGFHECWMRQFPAIKPEFSSLSRKQQHQRLNDPKTKHVWNNPVKKAFENGKVFMDELEEGDFNISPDAYGLSRSERQWLQIQKHKEKDNSSYADVENLRLEMSQWKYPLNFIDFETSAVAIPFTSGMRPYEQLAFQYSHHIVHEDGRVEHASEYINVEKGILPNFDFIRALKRDLEINEGSIFRYHNHENTIVNVIHYPLSNSDEPDRKELCDFIESISHSTGSNPKTYAAGPRDMIDLQRTVVRNYFHPQTGGSNSIKAILPAVLESSERLKEKYTQPIGSINLTSKNFENNYVFLKMEDDVPTNPYKTLPPLFDGLTNEQLEEAIEHATNETPQIANGGAALFAYAKLQGFGTSDLEHTETVNALLRYCELDTLAMVMIYEYFNELCGA
ncbi:protein of unknown function [Nonlabens sp. Hel1_33_55]|uniref:DUF2779 domain-containing protein n=1 Tax=Nonlabens sp. Hel1_33_55 TaxID=1336802 RepID=UPI000875AC02|nr:DUF2779 domain-containing protein [Nonlabens sp. Hel1_33_55]SCY41081.1 protein of unknown function [Nonlabens sp. Hel1_33_55]